MARVGLLIFIPADTKKNYSYLRFLFFSLIFSFVVEIPTLGIVKERPVVREPQLAHGRIYR